MSDEFKVKVEEINAVVAPIFAAIQRAAEKYRPVVQAISVELEKAQKAFAPIALEIQKSIEKSAVYVQKWQVEKKIEVSTMAENGWFPNWYTFFFRPEEEINSLDDFMTSQIDECWDELKDKMHEFCPNRSHILDAIFKLHEEGNYIASIPLIFAQADGVCGEEFTHFFSADPNTKKKASDTILDKVDDGEIKLNFFTECLLEPFKTKLQLANGSSKSSQRFKSLGPNRHGILHGSRKHLDYGTKINSYKSISFLAFLIYTTKDEFKKP
jgi:hypothetical protein